MKPLKNTHIKIAMASVTIAVCAKLSYSQQVCDKVEHVKLNAGFSGNPMGERFPLFKDKKTLYYFRTNSTSAFKLNSQDTIFSYSITNRSQKSYTLKFKSTDGQLVYDAFFSDKWLWVLGQKEVLTFERVGKTYVQISRKRIRLNFQKIVARDGKHLILGVCYNFHPRDQRSKTIIAKYNWKRGKIEKIIYPDFTGVEFSHLSNNWFTSSNSRIYFSQTLDYNIKEYDFDLNETATISSSVISSSDQLDVPVILGKPQAMQLFEIDTAVGRILEVFTDGDSTLGVVYKTPGMDYHFEYKLDIWKRKEGKWSLVDSSIYVNSREVLYDYGFKSDRFGLCPYLPQTGENVLIDGRLYEIRSIISKSSGDGLLKTVGEYVDSNAEARTNQNCGVFLTIISLSDFIDESRIR